MKTTQPITSDGAAPKQAAHTSGPWKQMCGARRIIDGHAFNSMEIHSCRESGWTLIVYAAGENVEANARLLAAAPALLEALIDIRSACIRNGFESELANQAIQQATGQA